MVIMLKFNDKETEELRVLCEKEFKEPMTIQDAQDAARLLCHLYHITAEIIQQNEEKVDLLLEHPGQLTE